MKALVASSLSSMRSANLATNRQAARWLWHDSVGCAYSGYRAPEIQSLLAMHQIYAPGAFVTPGGGAGLNSMAAAFLNAMAICRDEACEGLAVAHGRPGVPIIAALWPLALQHHASWHAVLDATVFGYQIGGTMGAYLRIRPGMHVDGCWPALGTAAAIAHLLNLPEQGIVDALECCASQLPASLYLPVRQGSLTRNTYLGHSAWLGMTAALTAAAGIRGPDGAAQAYAKNVLGLNPGEAIPLFGDFLIKDSYWKPYASVRHVQYGAIAAAAVRNQIIEQGACDEIEKIRLYAYPEALTYCGNRAPRHLISAQFSLSFGVAAMLRFGDLGPDQFRESALSDPQVCRLEALVELFELKGNTGKQSGRAVRLEVLYRGRWISEARSGMLGDPEQPVSCKQRHDKYLQYCDGRADALGIGQQILEASDSLDAAAILNQRY